MIKIWRYDMAVNTQKIDQLINFVKTRYPDWQDFSDVSFTEDEITYKVEASENAKKSLAKDLLQTFIDTNDTEGFIQTLERVAQSTNLLYMGTPKTGDLSILYDEGVNKTDLCKIIFDLLHGQGSVDERLERYLEFIEKNSISLKWAFPTYYLYLLFPETEIIIKPSTTRWFLNFIESDIKYSNRIDINIYTTFREYAVELKAALEDLNPKSMIDIQAMLYIAANIASGEEGGVVSIQKRREFKRLFEEFIQDYPHTQSGKDHIAFYPKVRKQATNNYESIQEKVKNGEDTTDDILLKLLPYANTENNITQGAWVHPAPAITGDIKKWFQNLGRQKAENWPMVANEIISFIEKCIDNSSDLEKNCQEFSKSKYSIGFQTGMVTPILNALKPDEYILINNKSRAMFNYFTDSKYSQKIIDYPKLNTLAKQFILEIEPDISSIENVPAIAFVDLVDIFSHWLVTIKKFKFSGFDELAQPFSEMFNSRDQADWAFDFLAETSSLMGVKNADDPMAAFTLRKIQGSFHIRMNFGSWLILGISGRNGEINDVTMALFEGDYGIKPTYEGVFSQDKNEQPVHLFTFPYDEFRVHETEIREAYKDCLVYILKRFEGWKGSPHHIRSVSQLAQAIIDLETRDTVLQDGLNLPPISGDENLEGTVRYWKISPGEDAWNWQACKNQGFITIGWDELGDLSGLSQQDFEKKRDELLTENPDWTKAGTEQAWTFYNIQKGDIIIANHGTTKILGIGKVTGDYFFISGERHGHRLPVKWFDLEVKLVNEGGWRKTIIQLEKEKYDQLIGKPPGDGKSSNEAESSGEMFTDNTFNLLSDLHQNPTKDFYNSHKDRFNKYLFIPIKDFYKNVAREMPSSITEVMETEKNLFSKILKNDYGKGGANDFFWGAFFPKATSRRAAAPQLSIWINKDRLEFGFYIGIYGDEFKRKFVENTQKHFDKLKLILRESLDSEQLIYGAEDSYKINQNGEFERLQTLTWEDFLKNPEQANFNVTCVIPKRDVINKSTQELVEICIDTYLRVFPLVLLTISSDPLTEINEYLENFEQEEEIFINPDYTLIDCANDIYLDEEQIGRWTRAIKRKGQAILYGPPGTGKTYIAEHLARHLISKGDGFVEIVQFHPSYAYEDFIQGIRPQIIDQGKILTYPMVSGRFLDFCRRAKMKKDKCVLIIDEINRANLSRVFGELMYLLEYRNAEIPLSGSGTFSIPENVLIIGTMNTADRSIALVDHALRRRFAFLELEPNYETITKFFEDKSFNPEGLIKILQRLNSQINDKHYEVGISFFLVEDGDLSEFLEDIWRMEIEPYLEEIFFDQQEKLDNFRWEKISDEILQ